MTPKLYRNVLIGAAVLVGFALFFQGDIRRYFDRNSIFLTEVTRVNAAGAKFALTKVEWAKFFDMWEVRGDVVLEKLPRGKKSISYKTALNGVCGALLTKMVDAPEAVGSRSEVFRVVLNFWQFKKGSITREKVFDIPVALPVEDGACPLRAVSMYSVLSYPPPLNGWKLVSFGEDLIGANNSDVSAHFVHNTNTPTALEGFAFDEACVAVLKDAPLFRPSGPIADGETLAILAGRGASIAGLRLTVGIFVEYLVVNDGCIRIGEGELT